MAPLPDIDMDLIPIEHWMSSDPGAHFRVNVANAQNSCPVLDPRFVTTGHTIRSPLSLPTQVPLTSLKTSTVFRRTMNDMSVTGQVAASLSLKNMA